jgi:hypothetical protein
MKLYSTFDSPAFQEAYTKIMTAQLDNSEDFVKESFPQAQAPVGTHFEGVGVLLSRKLVDIELVDDLLPVDVTWDRMKPWVPYMRQKYGRPSFFEWFEYLYMK